MNNKMKIVDGKINFRCRMDYCEHCCCGSFNGINKLLSNVDDRPFEEIVLVGDDYDNLCSAGRSDLIEEGHSKQMNKKYYKMALEEDGTCKALVNGKCSIYKNRPTLCSAFPFYFDMFSGLCAVECEGFSDDGWTDLKEYNEAFDAAKRMYSFWIDFYTVDD